MFAVLYILYGLNSHHSVGKSRVAGKGHEEGTAGMSQIWSENDLEYFSCGTAFYDFGFQGFVCRSPAVAENCDECVKGKYCAKVPA